MKKNYSFLCFDFRGHGMSSGNFTDFGVGDWYKDLCNVIRSLKINNILLIGSSMGGWVAMLYALRFPKKVKKLIGIAPAPDFTTNLVMKELTKIEKKKAQTYMRHSNILPLPQKIWIILFSFMLISLDLKYPIKL